LKSLRSLLSLLLIATSSILSVAQVYPVQATVQLTPPYSLYLADYVESGTERLVLSVFLADIARPQLDIRFRLKIIGQGITIETKPEYRPAPMSIQGGVPLRLVSTDLTDYFNASNLNFQGISRREYEQRGMLPEGVFQFCFEVLEYNRGIKVSNTACGTAWMILNDPPIINLPRQNEKLKAQSPQNVVLQWTPRHTGSPNSAFTTEYDVTLVEVWPSTRNPNDAILTSPPIFETTTGSTTVVYGPAETPLEPGRRYAFRVRARSIAGVSELDLFKNNGYSEVVTFIYGDACDLPTGIAASSIGTARFSLGWEGAFNHTGYKIRYREAGTTNWYENNVAVNAADIYSLKPATTYEYQVAATCGFYDGQYSAVSRITTNPLPEAEYACGAPLGNFTLDPNQLTGSLKAGDIIQAGDFDVKLTKVNGSNGIFTGEGVIEVPYLNKAKVKVEFTSIAVNKELRMVNGSMNVTGAAVDVIPQGVMDLMDDLTETLNTIDSALVTAEENLPKQFDPDSFVADTLIDVKNGINSVYKDTDGSVVVVDNKGNEQRIPAGTSAAIKDNDGNGYLVDSKGNVHKTTADVAAKAGSREFNFALKFTANTAMRYGFDERKHDAIAKDYEQLKQGYSVPWKSVPSGGTTDVVTAIVYGTSIDKSKITFEQSGVPLQPQPFTGNQTTLSVRGGSDGIEEGLLALYSPADTGKVQVLGKLNVVAYNKLSNPVVIVPVNKTTLPSGLTPKLIEDSLNAIYSQAIADWKVSVASPIEVDLTGTFDTGETGMLSNYTDDMKKVIKAFGNLQDETYYIFLVENPSDAAILGYMPRGKQAGFVFVDRHGSNKDAFVRTIAHELGHGAYSLHHTFKEPNFSLTQGATDNLMDYPSGKKLYKYQWDKMRYPDIVVGLFEEDEEGESAGQFFSLTFESLEDSKQPQATKKVICRISPDGQLFDVAGLGEYNIAAISPSRNYVVQSLWKPVFSTNKEIIGYEDIIYKFKAGTGNNFGQYFPYNDKTKKFIENGEAMKLMPVATCETILQKLLTDDACGFISIRKPNLGNTKVYISIQGASAPMTMDKAVSYIEEQIAKVPAAIQSPEALALTVEEKIARNCTYAIGESDCADLNIETLRKQKTEVESMISTSTVDALVKKVNEVGVCVLMELSYEQIEQIFDKLASQSSINDDTELALFKLMRSINSTKYSVFVQYLQGKDKNYKTLVHLIDEISGDNYITFTKTISIITASISKNDDLKWTLANAWITERYGSLKDHEKNRLGTIFSSMDSNRGIGEKASEANNVFFDLLLKDISGLKDFRLIYQVAILRQAHAEMFASFTQVDVKFSNPSLIYCITSLYPTSSFDELNWLKPVPFTLTKVNCPGGDKTLQIPKGRLSEMFEWSLFLENNETIGALYDKADTKQQYIQIFLDQFNSYVKEIEQGNAVFWQSYTPSNDCSSLNSVVDHIQKFENSSSLGKVDKQLRLSLIKLMFNCGNYVNEQRVWKLEYSENVLIKLLASFEKTDASILTTLEEIGIGNICAQLEGAQFGRVSLWISAQLQSAGHTKPLIDSQLIDGDGGVKALFNGVTFVGDNKILQLEADMFQWKNFSGSFTSPTDIRTELGQFAYNQEVLVYVAGDFEFLGQQIKKGSILQIPLIQAYAMSESNRDIVFTKTMWTAFDIASLAIGLGEVKILFKAGQIITKSIVLADIGGSTAGLIVNAVNENFISPQLRSKIQLLSIAASAPQMLRSIGKVSRLIEQADGALNEVRSIDNVSKASQSYVAAEKYASTIYEKLKQASSIVSKFDELLLTMKNEAGFMKNYNSLTDEMKVAFRADFSSASDDILTQLKLAGSEFFEGWKKFRTQNPSGIICAN
jgi:TANFOR domain-containing protein